MFDIGDRVVCISEQDCFHDWIPKVGCVYTVEDVGECVDNTFWIDLVEDTEPRDGYGWEANAFRKIGRADLLTKLLAEPQPQDERDGKRVVMPA